MSPLFIPPPPISAFHLGPLTLHIYSITMVTAIALSWWWSGRRIAKRGGDRDQWDTMALFAVIFGIVGARTYHVVTEHARYFGAGQSIWNVFKIWNGGLGVVGSIIGGGLAVLVYCLIKRIRFTAVADCVAPTILAAQAWGRVGNWFNQEAFGKPTTLPWALEVDPGFRPPGYEPFATFHPTFLYEGIWNLIGLVVILVVVERRLHWGRGKILTSYVLWYTFGRFFIELIRIDPVNQVGGFRINDVTTGLIFVVALLVLLVQLRFAPGADEYPFGPPDESEDTEVEDEKALIGEVMAVGRVTGRAAKARAAREAAAAAAAAAEAETAPVEPVATPGPPPAPPAPAPAAPAAPATKPAGVTPPRILAVPAATPPATPARVPTGEPVVPPAAPEAIGVGAPARSEAVPPRPPAKAVPEAAPPAGEGPARPAPPATSVRTEEPAASAPTETEAVPGESAPEAASPVTPREGGADARADTGVGAPTASHGPEPTTPAPADADTVSPESPIAAAEIAAATPPEAAPGEETAAPVARARKRRRTGARRSGRHHAPSSPPEGGATEATSGEGVEPAPGEETTAPDEDGASGPASDEAQPAPADKPASASEEEAASRPVSDEVPAAPADKPASGSDQ